MKRKYRIKEKNGRFYPQERIFLFWDTLNDVTNDKPELWFDSLELANDYINKQKEKRKVTYHKVL